MFQHQLDQQNKSISKRIADALAGWVPRRATVVRPERNGVWVRFDTENASAPESWFVCTVSGVSSGTSGWVFAIGGGKGVFITTGLAVPIPFVAHSGNSGTAIQTTSITTYTYHTLRTLTIPPGTYRVEGMAQVPMSRSVASGEMWLDMRVGGTSGTPRGANLGAGFLGISAGQWFPMSAGMGGDQFTTTDGSVALEIGVRGGVTAGTTQARIASVTGTITRIS